MFALNQENIVHKALSDSFVQALHNYYKILYLAIFSMLYQLELLIIFYILTYLQGTQTLIELEQVLQCLWFVFLSRFNSKAYLPHSNKKL